MIKRDSQQVLSKLQRVVQMQDSVNLFLETYVYSTLLQKRIEVDISKTLYFTLNFKTEINKNLCFL